MELSTQNMTKLAMSDLTGQLVEHLGQTFFLASCPLHIEYNFCHLID